MFEEIKLFIDVCIGSLPIGSIYCLLALSFVLIFKATKIMNLCQGEIMMLGAYATYGAMQSKLSFAASVFVALVVTSLVVFPLERFIVRKFMGKPIFVSIMATIGTGIFLRGLIAVIWGVDQKVLNVPHFQTMLTLPVIHMSYGKLAIILMAIVFILILELFFKLSQLGMAMRSTASNLSASMIMGVNVGHIFSLSWLIASFVSVFTGIFLSKLTILEPTVSQYAFVALSALVLGGVDSIKGTIIAGYTIGLVENLTIFYIGGQSKGLAGFIVMFLVLMLKPYGLFGIKKIERV